MNRPAIFWSLIMLSALFSSCSLTPKLPAADGAQLVGYTRLVIEDAERWVDVQAFYPAAEKTDNQPEALPKELANILDPNFGVPASAMADTRLLPAYQDAPVTQGAHPVLLFNHGHGSFATQNLHNMLYLASHGYIVLTLSHPTYSALAKNGEVSMARASTLAPTDRKEIKALVARQAASWDSLRATQTLSDWRSVMSKVEQENYYFVMSEFTEWVANNEFVLQNLSTINSGALTTPLTQALDLHNIGMFGHSFGGSVATHMNWQYEQVKASVNLDGPVFVESVTGEPSGAFCFAYSDTHKQFGTNSDFSWVNRPVAQATNGCERKFLNASHMNFGDLNEIRMLRWFGVLGKVDAELMRDNVNVTLLDFFNQHLRAQGEMSMLPGTETQVY